MDERGNQNQDWWVGGEVPNSLFSFACLDKTDKQMYNAQLIEAQR